MYQKWSTKELVRYYELQLEKGIIREGGAAYKRMLKFKDELEEILKKKRIKRMRRASKLMQSSNGKASK
tara:strand:+ start:89 stop:295 length:207 start_codon:yes stop_codon:yes gene_type:complete